MMSSDHQQVLLTGIVCNVVLEVLYQVQVLIPGTGTYLVVTKKKKKKKKKRKKKREEGVRKEGQRNKKQAHFHDDVNDVFTS